MEKNSVTRSSLKESKLGGILKGDINKAKDWSVEFRETLEYLGQEQNVSPQPSSERLSVVWSQGCPSPEMELHPSGGGEVSEDEDYSASVSAVMLRRGSTRRGKPSRRASVFTTSSAETAISIEEVQQQDVTQEQIYENIRIHKEVLNSVKQQPLGMRRKLKLVRQAKLYIKRHEGALQERLAQSKSTRDIVARLKILLNTRWNHMKREAANFSNFLIPWELRIKEIESHFGSVVASYFTFLRWLFWVNLVISVVLIVFVIVPEVLTANHEDAGERKRILDDEKNKSTNLLTLWEFEGVLKYSPIFYGYYTNRDSDNDGGYRLPMAYLTTGLAVYVYSFVATLRKMAENSRMSKLSEKEDECIFSWKLFTGWDFMIGNAETAHNRTASIVLGFKEALLEEAEKKKDLRNWRTISLRVLVNLCVVFLLVVSAYAVVEVVDRSTEENLEGRWWRQNETTIVMSLISVFFPILFELLGFLERYHPRKQLRIQLGRIMLLNLLNLYSLIFAQFNKIGNMADQLQRLKPNRTLEATHSVTPFRSTVTERMPYYSTNSPIDTTDFDYLPLTKFVENCWQIEIDCSEESSAESIDSHDSTTESPAMLIDNTDYHYFRTDTTNPSTEMMSTDATTEVDYILQILPGINMSLFDTEDENTPEDDDYYDYNSVAEYAEIETSPKPIEEENSTRSHVTTQAGDNTYETVSLYTSPSWMATSDWSRSTGYTETNSQSSTDQTNGDNYTLTMDGDGNLTTPFLTYETTDNTTFYKVEYTTPGTESVTSTYPSNRIESSAASDLTSSHYQDTHIPDHSKLESKLDLTTQLTFSKNIETTNFLETTTRKCYTTVCTKVTMPTVSTENSVATGINAIAPTKEPTEFCNKSSYVIITKTKSGGFVTTYKLDLETKKKLRKLCWETMFGQELVKLTVMDLVFTTLTMLFVDFFRAVFVRFMNKCWCWDLEKKFPQYGDFKIAENILHLVNNQGLVWMGMFFSPGIVLLNLIKLELMMYLRSWAVMTCNVPHEVVFRASRSNNFYLALLLTMLFLCVLPVGYAIVWVEPSWHCGPFSDYEKIYHLFTKNLERILPPTLKKAVDYIASPGIVIPLLVLLVLIIYYLLSLTTSLREANNDLKMQLRRERTEERRKMFQMADRRRRAGSNDLENTPFAKWKRILPALPPTKSIDSDEKKSSDINPAKATKETKKGALLNKIVRLALGRSNPVSIEKPNSNADDETDTEFHESLPEEVLQMKDINVTKPNTATEKVPASTGSGNRKQLKIKTGENVSTPVEEKNKVKSFNFVKDAVKQHKLKSVQVSIENNIVFNESEREKAPKSKMKVLPRKGSVVDSEIKLSEDTKYKSCKVPPILELKEQIKSPKDSFDITSTKKLKRKQTSDSSNQSKQSDSVGSVIPVITISKTESDDDMLSDRSMSQMEDKPGESSKSTATLKTLRRQNSFDSIKGSERVSKYRKSETK